LTTHPPTHPHIHVTLTTITKTVITVTTSTPIVTAIIQVALVAPFRLVSGFRAFFFNHRADSGMPSNVTVTCELIGAINRNRSPSVILSPATRFPSDGKASHIAQSYTYSIISFFLVRK
jgi:hypothetical protein